MPRIVFLLLGIYLLALSVGFFAGYTPLVREKFRSRPDIKPYMRKCGAVYTAIGLVGLVFYFAQDAVFASLWLAVGLGAVCFLALLGLIVINYRFIHKG
jgi:hypothetical protein